jgi:hypothetical protein
MTYEEFEWHILRLVYEEDVERIQPAYLAYALGIPHETATDYLDRATQNGVVEMDVTEDGSIEYFIPGAQSDNPMPSPVWKEQDEVAAQTDSEMSYDAARREQEQHTEEASKAADALMQASSDEEPEQATPDRTNRQPPAGADASVGGQKVPSEPPADTGADGTVGGPEPSGGPGTTVATRDEPDVPPEYRDHIRGTDQTDGTLDPSQGGRLTVVDQDASVEEKEGSPNGRKNVLQALEESDRDLPIRIESTDETFSDPSQTIFMRQLRVEGVESEAALREHIHRLFESLGYNVVENEDERMRFERGSVTFILALVPLFVLVLPLFVYLFLYCMGRSTIHQEPLELDVQLRRSPERDDVYEIDLTFIGLHGVVLGAADQRVLNKEVDTLRDELQWALTTG